ncbi:hypothetical protein EDC32_102314 [Laceyella sacchari]|nr:hypothetical protein EDC32_102314 [Laceyella sacchari]
MTIKGWQLYSRVTKIPHPHIRGRLKDSANESLMRIIKILIFSCLCIAMLVAVAFSPLWPKMHRLGSSKSKKQSTRYCFISKATVLGHMGTRQKLIVRQLVPGSLFSVIPK